MIINSIKIKNIRSYLDEEIEFPNGTTLLSGDIGCGKSSILLAIEFALFGIMRGSLSGSSLLRHGKNEGFVELNITIDGKKISVYRALKRSKDNVTQDVGYITTDGTKFEGTPVELKAKIIEMIGYPQELVSKSKSLIFRYTVYTPQEEMKNILLEGSEARLDTLRKIFNIDKYKRIKENSAILARDLRSEAKSIGTNLEGKKEVEEKLLEKEDLKNKSEKELKKIKENLEKHVSTVENAKKKVKELEESTEKYRKLQNELEVLRNSFEEKEEIFEDLKEEILDLKEEIDVLGKEVKGNDAKDLKTFGAKIKKGEEAIEQIEEKLNAIIEKEAKFNTQKDQAEEIKEEIGELDECPVCRQNVSAQHLEKVNSEQDSKIKKLIERIKKAEDFKAQLNEKLSTFKDKVSELREKEKDLSSISEKIKRLDDKKENLKKIVKEKSDVEEKLDKTEKKIESLEKQVDKNKGVMTELEKAREEYEDYQEELKEVEIEKASLEKELEGIDDSIKELLERKKGFDKMEKKLSKVKETLHWMDEYFVKVIDVMEKQVMLKIYGEFNEYFVSWFNVLMEDETISVRLDEEFSPVIVQDGYETSVDNLSGGEKTSVALAYRLSLNKVINDFISTIKTRDLIILDEPTDGFSSEQLDRVREVLKQLNIAQILIVSHEPKMESYVDSVIKVVKNDHVSTVA